MDIPGNIGKHCTLPSCNELDFLPIKCTHCAQIYCKDHVFPDYHQCSSLSANTGFSSASTEKLERCALDKCNKPSLESFISDRSADANRSPALCSHCQKSFCVDHRHPSSHVCSPAQSTNRPKNEAARALLAKHFPTSAKATSTAPSPAPKPKTTDPKKLAQIRKVELMKMRHRALPVDPRDKSTSVEIDQRFHLQVIFEGDSSTTKVFWFRKTLIAGKALDYLASHFKLSPPLALRYTESEEHLPLQLDRSLSEQIVDGSELHHLTKKHPSLYY